MALHAIENDEIRADNDPNLLNMLISYVETFEDTKRESIDLSNRDRDYNDHNQWSGKEKAILRQRGQQPVINNVIRKKMNFLMGYERKIRTKPKARPRTPDHDKDAQAVTDALQYVADNSNFDEVRSSFWDNYLIEGIGAVEVTVSKDDKREIQTNHIMFDRLIYDIHSRKKCFSDARWKGIVIWENADDIKRRFPKSEDVINAAISEHSNYIFSDKPTFWADSKSNRAKIVQMYFIYKGLWHLAFFTESGFLSPPTLSPWLDENRQPESGIVLYSAYVDRDGNRFGEPRFMIETQDGINHRESKMQHLLSKDRTFGNKRAFPDGVKHQKAQLARPDGHIEMSGDSKFGLDFGIIPNNDMANGQFQLLQESKQAAISTSTSSFQSGVGGETQSGRAVIANQNGQQIELNPLADGKQMFEQLVYKLWWNRIRQFWTAERLINVTDDESNAKFVQLNKKVTVADVLEEDGIEIPESMRNDPRLNEVSRIDNKVSEIDVDIIITDAPDITAIQSEEFDKLIQLANIGITFDKPTYIKASNLRNKDELLKGIQGQNEQEQQALQQQQQAQQAQAEANIQLQDEAVAAEIEKDGEDSNLKRAQTVKTQQEALQKSIENDFLEQGIKL